MIKGKVENIRSKTEKREIVQYILLRERILGASVRKGKTEYQIKIAKARLSEITMLINHIKNDTVRAKVKRFHQQIHIDNDHAKKLNDVVQKGDEQ